MLKIQEIREIIKLVDQSSIDEFMYEHDGEKIKMKKSSAVLGTQTVVKQVVTEEAPKVEAAPTQQAPAQPVKPVETVKEESKPVEVQDTDNLHKITSPMVGTFYASPSPDAEAYVKTGSKVTADSVVCIVEAMKLFNEIEAEVSGEIVEILVKDGQLVEYGQPLFLVKPE